MSVLKPCLERNPNLLTQTFRELGLPRREAPMLFFFSGKNYEFSNRGKERYNFETAKGRNLNFGT